MNRTILTAVASLTMVGAGCGNEPEFRSNPRPETRAEEIRPVRVLKVDAAAPARSIEFAGDVRARYETRLGFRVGGKMVERLVEVGATVRPGQPLARLDPRDLELAAASAKTQIAQLEAERRFAQGDLKRYHDLREKNFISQAELERRARTFESIDARLEAARAQYRQSEN